MIVKFNESSKLNEAYNFPGFKKVKPKYHKESPVDQLAYVFRESDDNLQNGLRAIVEISDTGVPYEDAPDYNVLKANKYWEVRLSYYWFGKFSDTTSGAYYVDSLKHYPLDDLGFIHKAITKITQILKSTMPLDKKYEKFLSVADSFKMFTPDSSREDRIYKNLDKRMTYGEFVKEALKSKMTHLGEDRWITVGHNPMKVTDDGEVVGGNKELAKDFGMKVEESAEPTPSKGNLVLVKYLKKNSVDNSIDAELKAQIDPKGLFNNIYIDTYYVGEDDVPDLKIELLSKVLTRLRKVFKNMLDYNEVVIQPFRNKKWVSIIASLKRGRTINDLGYEVVDNQISDLKIGTYAGKPVSLTALPDGLINIHLGSEFDTKRKGTRDRDLDR